MSEITAAMANLPVQSNPTENDSEGGVVNPIGPLDSSIEPEEDDNDEIAIEHLPDSGVDHEFSCDEISRDISNNEAASETVQPSHGQGESHSPFFNCYVCLKKFARGVRFMWATRQTEDTKENRELVVKITLRELIVYLVFLIDLCILTFGMTNSMTYYFSNAVTELFVNQPSNPSDKYSTFKDINDADDWYNFAAGSLIPGLYATPQSGFVFNTTEVKPTGNVTAQKVLVENQLLGLPRLRLLRVRNDSCVVHLDFKTLIDTCYNAYTVDSEDHSSYGPANSPAWIYQTADQLDGSDYWGRLAVYNGGGYVQDLRGGFDEALATVNFLKDNKWIDRGARAVFVDFSLYNPNINLFCIVSMLCEFPATGGALTSWNVRTVKLLRYVSTMDYFVMACECLFGLFIIYYIVEEALEIARNRGSYFKSFYNILDLVIIVSSICCLAFSIYRSVSVSRSLTGLVVTPDKFVDLSTLSLWQLIFDCTLAITLFFVWMKMFKFISFNRTMNQLSVTISSCFKDLACFAIMFFIVFLSFAQLGYLVFGSAVETYSNFELALFSQFRILLGDFQFDELLQANRVLGPAYFILYVFFIFFILLNMFLAIMNDAYAEVKADMSRKQHEFEMIDFFKKSYRKVLAKLKLKKREKSANGQSATDDKTDNRTTHFDQWRNERLREGYTEAQIVAVSGRYDVDSGRSVDRTELRKMQADLNRQKFADKEDSDSLDLSDEEDDSSMTKSGSRRGGRRLDCRDGGGRGGGRGVTHEEFSMLQRRVDRMEHSIGSIVSKIDAVLVKLEAMEQTKARRRETVGRLLDSIAESEGVTDESKRQHMERLVRDELERWDSESCISGPFEGPPASSNSGRSNGRTRQEQSQDFYPSSNA